MKHLFWLLFLLSGFCLADQESVEDKSILDMSQYEFTPKFGVSPFVGVLGVEARFDHFALGLGIPTSLSLKYYVNADDDSWYIGVFNQRYTDSEFDDFEEGIFFNEYERRFYGIGFGYFWIWPSSWSLSLGLGIGPHEETYKISNQQLVKESDFVSLELNVGYTF